MMTFSTEHLRKVFAEEDKYEAFKKLTYDLNRGNEIYEYDEDGNKKRISKSEANKAVQKVIFEILELDETSVKSKKARRLAYEKHHRELFEVIEEEIEFKIQEGFTNSEWFNEFVEMKNLALGDDNEFWTDEKVYLEVAKVAGDHHNLTLQTLGEGESYRVQTSKFAVKVGADIDMVTTGRLDFTKLTDKVAEAFITKVQAMMYDEVMDAAEKLPSNSQFNKTGAIGDATKEIFDTLLEDVSAANGAEVVIMGTKVALKKLNALADVDWASEDQKRQINTLGRLGAYETTTLIEIPQRFAVGDTGTKLVASDKLLIMPRTAEKFVKFVDVGETEIREVNEKGSYADDFQSYEVHREMGIATQIGQYFGCWTIE